MVHATQEHAPQKMVSQLHTFLFADQGMAVHSAGLYKELPFDVMRDFEPVGMILRNSMLLVIQLSSPASASRSTSRGAFVGNSGRSAGSNGRSDAAHARWPS